MNSAEAFREPQRGFHHVEVQAPNGRPWPQASMTLEPRIVGAGREMSLDEFLELTSTTSLVVVVDGVLVHEHYAEAVALDDRMLGNSATKSVLALVTGIAVGLIVIIIIILVLLGKI